MRLLLIVNRVPAGGAETQLVHLARGLDRLGHQVTLCCVDRCELEPEVLAGSSVEVAQFGAGSRYARIAALPRLARFARSFDVVHSTGWDTSLWGRLAAILARRPSIVADHATDRSQQQNLSGAPRERWIELHNRLLDRFTFAMVACATAQRPILLGEGVSAAKIVYIPNGIPVEAEIAAATTSGLTRAGLGLDEDAPVVLQVGRFHAEKNQLGGLEAMQAVRDLVPGAQLAFAGDGPQRAEVEARAAAIGAGEWAHFLGNRSDVPGLIALADLTLLPSLADAMPMAVLESMAQGVPVVGSDVGDMRWVIGGGGATSPIGDLAGLAGRCAELLEDDEMRGEASAAARARAAEFDSSQMVGLYEELFEAAVAGDPVSPAPDVPDTRPG